MKKLSLILFLAVAGILVVGWLKYRRVTHKAIKRTSSLSLFKDDSYDHQISIKNSVYHPYFIINGKKGELYDQKKIIILEEYERILHPGIGWKTPSLTLTAWQHEDAKNLRKIWKISSKAYLSVRWSLDTDVGVLTVRSSNDSDGSDSNIERYDAFTGDAIETHKQ